MAKQMLKETLEIPSGIAVQISNSSFTVKGPKGSVTKKILLPNVDCAADSKTVSMDCAKPTRREKKIVYTAMAHLKNLFKGVTEGHTYKLKICSGHFPMNVSAKNNVVEVKNFFGETISRKIKISEDVTVKIAAPDITVEGIDLEKTSQAAAAIEQLTRRPGFDKNRFQDGIYIVEKDGRAVLP